MYGLAVTASKVKAHRGYPKQIKILEPSEEWQVTLKRAADLLGWPTDSKKPAWWLASYWGCINGQFRTVPDGTLGVRDNDHRCDMFSPGVPSNGGCQGDGHYLCSQCVVCALKESDRDHK